MTPLLTTSAVARELSVSRDTVRDLIVSGRLRAAKLGRTWRIERAELERFTGRLFGRQQRSVSASVAERECAEAAALVRQAYQSLPRP